MVRLGGGGSTDYTQPLAGGASLSITIPNDISSSSNTTINVANRPSGAVYTFAFPTPVPVINKSKIASSNLQADGNLSVTTSPTPCIIDDVHPSCQLVFNPTGAVNGTYQITPHYAATGTVTKADTALNSFNVGVSGQSTPKIAPFIVFQYGNNNINYAFDNGKYIPLSELGAGASIWYFKINNQPIYMATVDTNSPDNYYSQKYSYDGYSWTNSNNPCQSNENLTVDERIHGTNFIVGECVYIADDQAPYVLKSMWSSTNGKTWSKMWSSQIAPYQEEPLLYETNSMFATNNGKDILISGCSNNENSCDANLFVTYKLDNTNNSWELVNDFSNPVTFNNSFNIISNGNILIGGSTYDTVYYSLDTGKTWAKVNGTEVRRDYGFIPATNQFYIALSLNQVMLSVDAISWSNNNMNVENNYMWNFGSSFSPIYGYMITENSSIYTTGANGLLNNFSLFPYTMPTDCSDCILTASY